jgi:hypothetical protein
MLREFENLCEVPVLSAAAAGIHLRAPRLLRAVKLAGWRRNENPHWLCQTAWLKRKSLSGGN